MGGLGYDFSLGAGLRSLKRAGFIMHGSITTPVTEDT